MRSSFSCPNQKFFRVICTVLIVKQWRCFNLFYIYVNVSFAEQDITNYLEELVGFMAPPLTHLSIRPSEPIIECILGGKDSAYTNRPTPPPSRCSAGHLLSIITANSTDHLTWLPVEICVKE
jgi:hypothetical protein